jgi:hypothetical protein
VVLLAAGLWWLVGDLIGFGLDGPEKFAYASANPQTAGIAIAADLLAVPFFMGSVIVWFLLSVARAPRLSWVAAVLGVFGVVGQAVVSAVDVLGYAAATGGSLDHSGYDALVQDITGLPAVVGLGMFIAGAFLGTALAMVALWRARAVARGAVLLWLAFLAVNMAGVPMPTTILGLASLSWTAVDVLRAGRAVDTVVP